MTSEQLEAITVMQLTQEGMGEWLQEQGLGFGGGFAGGGGRGEVSEEARATRQAQFADGEGGEIPPEMATRRAEFESMSDEEREALRATRQAGGSPFGEGEGRPAGAGGLDGSQEFVGARQYVVFLQPLFELLEGLAAE